MRLVRVVESISHYIVEDIPRPVSGTARTRIEAACLPPYFAGIAAGNWRTPQRPFTPGQCAIGILIVTPPRSACVADSHSSRRIPMTRQQRILKSGADL